MAYAFRPFVRWREIAAWVFLMPVLYGLVFAALAILLLILQSGHFAFTVLTMILSLAGISMANVGMAKKCYRLFYRRPADSEMTSPATFFGLVLGLTVLQAVLSLAYLVVAVVGLAMLAA